jgi:hypothetical protein
MNRDAEIAAKTVAFRASCREMCVKLTGDGMVGRAVAARLLGYSPKTLKKWTSQKTGPAVVHRGRSVFYPLTELAKWAVERSVETDFAR